jgi:hypothetical protein
MSAPGSYFLCYQGGFYSRFGSSLKLELINGHLLFVTR